MHSMAYNMTREMYYLVPQAAVHIGWECTFPFSRVRRASHEK